MAIDTKITHVLLSFKSDFASLLFQKEKIWEVRKSRILKAVPKFSRGFIYETLPIGRITGCFTIGKTFNTYPDMLLAKLTFDEKTKEYLKSLNKNLKVFVIRVVNPIKFKSKIDPERIKGCGIPQSFRYLKIDELKKICEMAGIEVSNNG